MKKYLFITLLAAVALVACTSDSSTVRFNRFEHLLMDAPAASLQQTLMAHRDEFDTPLLRYAPDDRQYVAMVEQFRSDPAIKYIYHVTDSLYGDLSDIEKQLGKALARVEKQSPSIHYDRFYTLVTADFGDYDNRVFCSDHELAVSIDHYAIPYMTKYQSFGVPLYMQQMLNRDHIVPDCISAIARAHIALPDDEMTLLDYAIAEGKTIYFSKQALPGIHDSILLRYTSEQFEWMENNTAQVWAWLIHSKMLYSHDYNQFHNFIDEAPKTNAFGDGSAPRTTSYIGWQIVKRYMKRNNITMQELLENTDSQKILTESGWRP